MSSVSFLIDDMSLMSIRQHAHLRHVRQSSLTCVVGEALVAPEECAGHGSRDDEHIKQGPAYACGTGYQRRRQQPCPQSCSAIGLEIPGASDQKRAQCQTNIA